ncbi:efflux RND transporter periplasmic adaptor subunit [Mesorhizobium koreense]|jgi:membrane fusion protein (multidrug efflux system)|uniref:efflux RND transporter periplasmic adaptor subunit n=1 Tax=Mesorhizobium koreense TaxID=3074855 RepID=UPI00287B6A9E|nr:efflux RND transporter periplasmic adaptor subunit [Mesorhizobium sp. WR6]
MVKRLVIALILIVIVVGGVVGFNLFRSNAIKQYFANMPKPKLTVSTTVAEPMTWKPEIQAIGTVSARSGVDLTVEVSGVVRNIAFKSNEKVKAGQLLVQLDDAVQRANLEAEKAQAALDQQNLERAIELQKRQVGPQSNVQQAQAAASASAAQVDSLQAVLDQKRLTAPFSGTIGIPQIDVGQYLTPGNVVATLQDLDTMRVDFTVPEQQLPDLKIGQKVRLGLTGDDLKFEGKVIGIDPKVDPSTRLVSVRAEISNPNGALTPGQFAQVRVELPAEDNIIALPETALTTSLYGDFIYVVALADKDGKATTGKVDEADKNQNLVAHQVFVKIGRQSEGRIEIKDGVKPGDVIVNAGQNRLTNGAAVTIDNSVEPSQVKANPAGDGSQ